MNPHLRLLRPRQWIKNGFVIAPLFFAHKFTDLASWSLIAWATLGFLCISCVVYIGNDLSDIQEDRQHPLKKLRPLASNQVTVFQALLMAAFFAALSLLFLIQLPVQCMFIALVYLLLNCAYTLRLKHIAVVDVFFIALCYVLRVLMGCYALQVVVSPWIILTTFLLALFLGFGKRYHELGVEGYAQHKQNLQHYTREFLDRLVNICGGATLIAYAIYTAEIAQKTGRVEIVYTLVFVAFGLFRYMQAIYVYNQGGEPENIILTDKLQCMNIAIWLVMTLGILF